MGCRNDDTGTCEFARWMVVGIALGFGVIIPHRLPAGSYGSFIAKVA